jgi:hypothetical protein
LGDGHPLQCFAPRKSTLSVCVNVSGDATVRSVCISSGRVVIRCWAHARRTLFLDILDQDAPLIHVFQRKIFDFAPIIHAAPLN